MAQQKQAAQDTPLELFQPIKRATDIVLVIGPEGSGKTHFAGSVPEPLYVIGTEANHEVNTLARRFGDKRIYHAALKAAPDIPKIWFGAFAGMWQQLEALIGELAKSTPGTVLIDSASDLLGIAAVKLNKELDRGDKPIPPMMYSQVYPILKNWIGYIRERHNVVMTARVKAEYENEARTGNVQPDIWKVGPYFADHIVWVDREPLSGDRFGTVTKGDNEGKVLVNPTWNDVLNPNAPNAANRLALLGKLRKAFDYLSAKGIEFDPSVPATEEAMAQKLADLRALVAPKPVEAAQLTQVSGNGVY